MARLNFTNDEITDGDGSDGILTAGGFKFELISGSGTLSFANGGLSVVEAAGNSPFQIAITRLDGSTFSVDDGSLIFNGTPDITSYATFSGGGKSGTYGDFDYHGNPHIAVLDSGYGPDTQFLLGDLGSFGGPNPDSNVQIDYIDYTITYTPPPNDPPIVSSIVRAGGASASVPASTSSITYTVTFSEAVSGVDPSDFALSGTGTATGTISSLSGSGSTYTVVVNALTGEGMLRLDLDTGNTGIQDALGAAISGGYTSGQSYTIDRVAPAVPTPTLDSDTGASASDGVTRVGTVSVGGLEAGASWQYSTNAGASWTTGSGTGFTLAEGGYAAGNILVRQTDAAGNTSQNGQMVAVTLDQTAPILTIASDAASLKAGETATITFSFSEDPGSSFTWDGSSGDVVVSGGTLSAISGSGLTRTATFTPAANTDAGTASIAVTAGSYADAAGNINAGQADLSFTFDTRAPDTTIGARPDPLTNSTSATFDFASNESGASFEASLDGGAFFAASAPLTFTGLGDGPHTLSIRAVDAAGNVDGTPASYSWVQDTVGPDAPTFTLDAAFRNGVPEDALINTVVGTLTGEPGARFTILAGSPLALDASDTDLSDGQNVVLTEALDYETLATLGFSAVQTDAAGNVSMAATPSISILNVADDGDDPISGTDGADLLHGFGGNDTILGGLGNDTIYGGEDNDVLQGNQGNDWLQGNQGDDWIGGGQGNDWLGGGQGNDILNGGSGDDILTGGRGADLFVFVPGQGHDMVYDFNFADGDRLDLEGQGYRIATAADGSATLLLDGGGSVVLHGIAPDQVSDFFLAV